MQDFFQSIYTNPLLWAALAVGASMAIWWIPKLQISAHKGSGLSWKDRFEAENEARKTAAQTVLGLGLFATLFFSSLSERNQQRAMEQSTKNWQQEQERLMAQSRRDQEKWIEDKWRRTLDDLSSNDPGKQRGALDQLKERGLQSSNSDDIKQIIDQICDLLHRISPRKGSDPAPETDRKKTIRCQVAIEVLGALSVKADMGSRKFDLRSVDLRDVQFPRSVSFREFDFSSSRLDNLEGANLSESKLYSAQLEGNLVGANFSNSDLRSAHCDGADIDRANFTGARTNATPADVKAKTATTFKGVKNEEKAINVPQNIYKIP